jgi:serine/threonine-protein kinase RsbW
MQCNSPIKYFVELPSLPTAVEELSKKIVSELTEKNFGDSEVFAVRLALEEAFINAIEHGNQFDCDKNVEIKYVLDDQKIEISIKDQGPGFNRGCVPDPRKDENLFKTSGRGLLLIETYMDEISYNKKGNCLRMIKYRQKGPFADNSNQAAEN